MTVPEAQRVTGLMEKRLQCRAKSAKFSSLFGLTEHPHLRNIGTEQVRQILHKALSVHVLAERDPRVGYMFYSLFVKLYCPLSYILPGPIFSLW